MNMEFVSPPNWKGGNGVTLRHRIQLLHTIVATESMAVLTVDYTGLTGVIQAALTAQV